MGCHWITVSTIGAPADTVRIYDSNLEKPTNTTLDCIAKYHKCENNNLTYEVMQVQKQPNGFDCGPFAIAFATSLLSGADPSSMTYQNPRNHLRECFRLGYITDFPSKLGRRTEAPKYTIKEEIFCICRGIDIDVMVQCDNCFKWYHVNSVWKKGDLPAYWLCIECK